MDWSWLFPTRCVCCTRRIPERSKFNRLISAACIRCQPRLDLRLHHIPQFSSVISIFDYSRDGAFLMRAAKYHPNAPLLTQLGEALALHYPKTRAAIPEAIVVAPSHPRLLSKRGLNPARLIASPLAVSLEVPLIEPFRRSPVRLPQAQLSRQYRRRSARHSIRCIYELPEIVLIVDDVMTSGSTLKTLAELAMAHGAKIVHAAVVCDASNGKVL